MAPTAQQLSAEWASEAEKETESDRLIRKSKQSPFVPIGEFFLCTSFADRLCLLKPTLFYLGTSKCTVWKNDFDCSSCKDLN